MSTIPAAEISQLVAMERTAQTEDYCSFAIIALLMFEWSLTLSREVQLYWKDRLTVAKVLFFVNRYLPLVVQASTCYAWSLQYTDQKCTAQLDVNAIFEYLQYIPWAVFAAMRAYAALGGQRSYIAALTLFLSSMPFIVNCLNNFIFSEFAYNPTFGCIEVRTTPPPFSIVFAVMSRGSLIVADTLVIAITWLTTYSTVRLEALNGSCHSSFSKLFLVNGTIYFIVLCTLNALYLSFTLSSIATDRIDGLTSYIGRFTELLTAIFINRFLLDLQEVKKRNEGAPSLGEMSSLNFDRVIGCLSLELQPEDVLGGGEVPGDSEEPREDPIPGEEIELVDRQVSVP